jgi:hypothetical protein
LYSVVIIQKPTLGAALAIRFAPPIFREKRFSYVFREMAVLSGKVAARSAPGLLFCHVPLL